MKRISKLKSLEENSYKDIINERNLLSKLSHPFLVQMYFSFQDDNYLYIINNLMRGGDLRYWYSKNIFFSERQCKFIISCIILGLEYLHSNKIIHRDLKPENILMTDNSSNADIRLVDFGLGKIIGPGEMCTDPFGTFSYVAPEVLKEKPYSFKVDLFAIGIIAYLLVAGFLPFDHETSEKEIARQTVYEPTPFPNSVWKNISNEARMFVDNLLQKNPDKRMGIQEVLQHKWLQKYNSKENISFKKRNERDLSGAQKFEAFSTISKV